MTSAKPLMAAMLLALAACQTVTAAAPTPFEAGQPVLTVEGEGLRWILPPNGAARPLDFGSDQKSVLKSLEFVRGPAGRGVNQDCGAGPVDTANWADGLSLVFQSGKFVGWGLDRRASKAIGTINGIFPGSTRIELENNFANVKVFGSTLGTEFAGGGFYGLLDGTRPTARITDMWAGVSCVAR